MQLKERERLDLLPQLSLPSLHLFRVCSRSEWLNESKGSSCQKGSWLGCQREDLAVLCVWGESAKVSGNCRGQRVDCTLSSATLQWYSEKGLKYLKIPIKYWCCTRRHNPHQFWVDVPSNLGQWIRREWCAIEVYQVSEAVGSFGSGYHGTRLGNR